MDQTVPIPYEQRILRRNGETWPRISNPPAWSQHRLELACNMAWFRSQQGGVQRSALKDSNGHFIQGLLHGGHPGNRAYLDAEIIIASLNGDRDNTPMSVETGHRRDAMRATIDRNRLVGVIFEVGSTHRAEIDGTSTVQTQAYQLLPCNNMPTGRHRQNCWVAAFFLPTFMWPTKIPGKNGDVWMVRLEKLQLAEQSWWANIDHGLPPLDDHRNFSIKPVQEVCPTCGTTSPRIYQEIFVCTNHDCVNVWREDGKVIALDRKLTYTNEFLQERQRRPLKELTYPTGESELVRNFPQRWNDNYHAQLNVPLTVTNFRERINFLLEGFACPYCKMINNRVRWHEWHCRNERCNGKDGTPYQVQGYPPTLTVKEVKALGRSDSTTDTFKTHRAFRGRSDSTDFIVDEFELGEGCNVAYLRPKPHLNGMPGSSDDLYIKIQELARQGKIPLERRGMNTAAGPSLTSHFSANYGEQYVFTARVPSIKFEESDPVVRNALDLVNDWVAPWRKPENNDLPANELYLAGYLEGQKMNFHDDGEVGLGDIITTYTLGGEGTFRLRIKPKYNLGHTKSKGQNKNHRWIDYDPVIPGCVKEVARAALKARLESGEITQAEWQQEFKTLMTDSKGKNVRLLDLPVLHGYLVIMYGPNTQKYLEHCADVTSPMRFALTFRHIKADHFDKEKNKDFETRLAYDVSFDPGKGWTDPEYLSPVGSDDSAPGSPFPALSPRDSPPPKRQRRDDSDDDDNDNNNINDQKGVASSSIKGINSGKVATGTRGGRGTGRGRGGRGRTSAKTKAKDNDGDIQMADVDDKSSVRTTRASNKRKKI